MRNLSLIILTMIFLSSCDGGETSSPHTSKTKTQGFSFKVFRKAVLQGDFAPTTIEVAQGKSESFDRKTIIKISQKGQAPLYRVVHYAYEPSSVTLLDKVSAADKKLIEGNDDWQVIKVAPIHLDLVEDYAYDRHYFETYRCRNSKFWAQTALAHPETRGPLMVRVPHIFKGFRPYYRESNVLLNIDMTSRTVSGLSVYDSDAFSEDSVNYVGVSLRALETGKLVAGKPGSYLAEEFTFSLYCGHEYIDTILGSGLGVVDPGPYLPIYNSLRDKVISEEMDRKEADELSADTLQYIGNVLTEQNIRDRKAYLPFEVSSEQVNQLIELAKARTNNQESRQND